MEGPWKLLFLLSRGVDCPQSPLFLAEVCKGAVVTTFKNGCLLFKLQHHKKWAPLAKQNNVRKRLIHMHKVPWGSGKSSVPRPRTSDVAVEMPEPGRWSTPKALQIVTWTKEHLRSSLALFQTLIYASSHTLALTHELSRNRIKERVHTHKMPC